MQRGRSLPELNAVRLPLEAVVSLIPEPVETTTPQGYVQHKLTVWVEEGLQQCVLMEPGCGVISDHVSEPWSAGCSERVCELSLVLLNESVSCLT